MQSFAVDHALEHIGCGIDVAEKCAQPPHLTCQAVSKSDYTSRELHHGTKHALYASWPAEHRIPLSTPVLLTFCLHHQIFVTIIIEPSSSPPPAVATHLCVFHVRTTASEGATTANPPETKKARGNRDTCLTACPLRCYKQHAPSTMNVANQRFWPSSTVPSGLQLLDS